MSVEIAIVEAAKKLWEQRGLARSNESLRLARALRPRAGSPGAWLTAVRGAHREFSRTTAVEGPLERKHVDAFFARLATVTATPPARALEPESSQAA